MNNIHVDFPANMKDGRVYSNWQPTAVINEQLRRKENIQTNWQYRAYIQSNAMSIMDYNKTETCLQSGCPSTYGRMPKYVEGDLKQDYLSRQEMQKRTYGFQTLL